MQRQAPEGDFRANIHRGGPAGPVILTAQESEMAVHAARKMGVGVAGAIIEHVAGGARQRAVVAKRKPRHVSRRA
jgi:ribosomal protein S6--L-glutamate ligase